MWALALLVSIWTGQGLSVERYERKTISYVGFVWRATPQARRMTDEQAGMLLEALKKRIVDEMPRFDYEPLPPALTERFVEEAGAEDSLSVEEVGEVLTETVAPTIMRILDLKKEMKAKGLVSEEERRSFVVRKAKELGITAEHLEKVMNSAYLFLPVVTGYERKVKEEKEKKTVSYSLRGGLAWFHLRADGRMEPLKVVEAHGRGLAEPDSTYKWMGRKLKGDEYAFLRAADWMAKNLAVRTAELEEFRLKGEVVDAGWSWVEFNLGKAEGLFVDQRFRVFEDYEEGGKVRRAKKGFFFVRQVGDRISRGKVIIGSYEPGMYVREFPRIGIDLVPRFYLAPLMVKTDVLSYAGKKGELKLSGDTLSVPSLELALQANSARYTGIPQSFLTVGLYAGLAPVKDARLKLGDEEKKAVGFCLGGYLGIMKKYYIKRLALVGEVRYQLHRLTFARSFKEEQKLSYSQEERLLSLCGGLEVALREDLNFGICAGYTVGKGDGWTEKWSQKVKGEEREETHKFTGPEVDRRGTFFGLHLVYSPPTL